ncbi:hypothetical protein ABZ814_23165 [Micromonospora musae]
MPRAFRAASAPSGGRHNTFLLAIGVLCGVFDLIYIGMLLWPAGH